MASASQLALQSQVRSEIMSTIEYRTTDISILQDFRRDKDSLLEHSGVQVTPKSSERLRKLLDLRVLILVDTLGHSLYSTCYLHI